MKTYKVTIEMDIEDIDQFNCCRCNAMAVEYGVEFCQGVVDEADCQYRAISDVGIRPDWCPLTEVEE